MTRWTTNQLLGYPDDARLLIVNADDFGVCHAVNVAIAHALDHGIVTSTSLMAPCAWAHHAMQLLRDRPGTPFAVHLTLVRDSDIYRWGPVSPWSQVPSLVGPDGTFNRFVPNAAFIVGFRLDEVEREFRAQIETVLTAGLSPTHLDWHCLADGGRVDIFDLTFRLAREYGLALRVHGRETAEHCLQSGLPVNDHPVLDSYHMGVDDKHNRFIRLLRELPPGLTEWAVHPSLGNDEAQALEPDTWQIRRADFDFITSDDARRVIDEESIILLDYRALREVWATTQP